MEKVSFEPSSSYGTKIAPRVIVITLTNVLMDVTCCRTVVWNVLNSAMQRRRVNHYKYIRTDHDDDRDSMLFAGWQATAAFTQPAAVNGTMS